MRVRAKLMRDIAKWNKIQNFPFIVLQHPIDCISIGIGQCFKFTVNAQDVVSINLTEFRRYFRVFSSMYYYCITLSPFCASQVLVPLLSLSQLYWDTDQDWIFEYQRIDQASYWKQYQARLALRKTRLVLFSLLSCTNVMGKSKMASIVCMVLSDWIVVVYSSNGVQIHGKNYATCWFSCGPFSLLCSRHIEVCTCNRFYHQSVV